MKSLLGNIINFYKVKQVNMRKDILTSCANILKKYNTKPINASFDEKDWRYVLYSISTTDDIYYKFSLSEYLEGGLYIKNKNPEKIEVLEALSKNCPSSLGIQTKEIEDKKILFFRIDNTKNTDRAAYLMNYIIEHSYDDLIKTKIDHTPMEGEGFLYEKEKRRKLFAGKPKVVNLEDLQYDTASGRITIRHNDIDFECCIVPKKSNHIYFFLSAAYKLLPDRSNYPTFHRASWADFMEGTCIYIDDAGKKSKGGGYFYDKSVFLLHEMVAVIKKFMTIFGVSGDKTFFIGSSLGGYAAMYLASEIPSSTCLAYSPIFSLPVFHENHDKNFFERTYQVSLNDKNADIFNRFDITQKIFSNDRASFFITFNKKASIDIRQIEHIHKYHAIQYKENFNANHFDNFYIYIYHIDCLQPHASAQPNEFFTQSVCENFKNGTKISNRFLYSHYITWSRHLMLQKRHKLYNDCITTIKDAIKTII